MAKLSQFFRCDENVEVKDAYLGYLAFNDLPKERLLEILDSKCPAGNTEALFMSNRKLEDLPINGKPDDFLRFFVTTDLFAQTVRPLLTPVFRSDTPTTEMYTLAENAADIFENMETKTELDKYNVLRVKRVILKKQQDKRGSKSEQTARYRASYEFHQDKKDKGRNARDFFHSGWVPVKFANLSELGTFEEGHNANSRFPASLSTAGYVIAISDQAPTWGAKLRAIKIFLVTIFFDVLYMWYTFVREQGHPFFEQCRSTDGGLNRKKFVAVFGSNFAQRNFYDVEGAVAMQPKIRRSRIVESFWTKFSSPVTIAWDGEKKMGDKCSGPISQTTIKAFKNNPSAIKNRIYRFLPVKFDRYLSDMQLPEERRRSIGSGDFVYFKVTSDSYRDSVKKPFSVFHSLDINYGVQVYTRNMFESLDQDDKPVVKDDQLRKLVVSNLVRNHDIEERIDDFEGTFLETSHKRPAIELSPSEESSPRKRVVTVRELA